jgi:hypothetical protein
VTSAIACGLLSGAGGGGGGFSQGLSTWVEGQLQHILTS